MSNLESTVPNIDSDAENMKASTSDNESQNQSEKKSSGNGFILFLMLLVVGVSAAAAFYLWDLQKKQDAILQSQQLSIEELKEQVEKTVVGFSENVKLVADNKQHIELVGSKIEQAEKISQQAIETVNRSQRGWVIAEIDYLLRIAHQRIAVAKDIGGAIAALKGADSRLEQLGDLSLFKIREQLSKDIGNLNAIHQADVNGISLALDQIIASLPSLPYKTVKDEIKIQFTQDDAVEQPKTEDKTFIDSVVETVKQIGDIKVHQKSIEAASSVEQKSGIEQLLRTYLLGARLAALRFNQMQFLHEIEKANEIIRLHYDDKDNRIQQMQKTLLDYSALQLSPDLPELTKAWTMLQSEIKSPARKTVNAAVANKSKKTASKAGVKPEEQEKQ
ncbi:MAG: hypothetical protein DIZ80_10740 [endosymbiont of Galathealinum brachiosum]|uniref:Enzyme of heme biosynthesis n=1 Tax=endosymbiont of Galathealinum brachiosum TaxID=2200906 RepID=A0A370DEL5_9GAMM|nr:MAG: hypothetical protein DIZ80_10740 [endosymbiont of Galathealinum brachiosum]